MPNIFLAEESEDKRSYFWGWDIEGAKLEENGKKTESGSANWWLNSGRIFHSRGDDASTNLGKLPKDNRWRKLYAENNPEDREDGYRPQNIVRLVTQKKWKNFSQELYFKIENINLADSPQRNESNGVLLFNRYQDGDNLYYTGVRVDGSAISKKKMTGSILR